MGVACFIRCIIARVSMGGGLRKNFSTDETIAAPDISEIFPARGRIGSKRHKDAADRTRCRLGSQDLRAEGSVRSS